MLCCNPTKPWPERIITSKQVYEIAHMYLTLFKANFVVEIFSRRVSERSILKVGYIGILSTELVMPPGPYDAVKYSSWICTVLFSRVLTTT